MRIHFPLYFRYILSRFFKTSMLLFITLLTTTLLIELSIQFSSRFTELLFFHMVAIFFKRLDLLLPLSYLFATVNLFGNLHKHNEINAMNTSGISMRNIIAPLYLTALLTAGFLTINHQFILPRTNQWLIDEIKLQNEKNQNSEYEVRFLNDGSRIIYTKGISQLDDLFWIKSHKEIWHCAEVSFEDRLPVGFYVDKFIKNEKHEFVKSASYHRYTLPEAFISAKPMVHQKNELSISTLFKLLTAHNLAISADRGYIYSLFCYKLVNPFFTFLVITGMIPFVLPYKRRYKQMNLYTIGTVAFFVFHSLIKSCIILAEHYVTSPLGTIILVPILIQTVLSYNLWKTLVPKSVSAIKKSSNEIFSQLA